jgi:hypothetical protein
MVSKLILGAIAAFALSGALPVSALAQAKDGILISGPTGASVVVSADQVEQLPASSIAVSFETDRGHVQASFRGPTLWSLLLDAKMISSKKPRQHVRGFVTITGQDGYTALVALGEIAPEFEGKNIILADAMGGKPLGDGHFRLVVPGDKRGGRSVRDVTRISVSELPTSTPQ